MTDLTPEDILSWKSAVHGSPLYHRLVNVVASDPELMRVLNRIEHSPRPNLLFGSIQYLLRTGTEAHLAQFYPSLTERPRSPEDVDAPFREFVLANEEAIVAIGRARYTQTNECRRCVVLLPAIMASRFTHLHLIDLGTSAGLNLAMDRYHYNWDGVEWGSPSPVHLEAELRGRLPALHDLTFISRIGLDLNPVDPADPDSRAWLASLIWPEQQARRERLAAALDLVSEVPIRLIAGDASVTLGEVLEALPGGDPVVVINSFSMNQFGEERREVIETTVEGARARRPILRISLELTPRGSEWATLEIDSGSGWQELGKAHPHGEWVEFYARP